MSAEAVGAVVDTAAWICTGYFLLANGCYLFLTILAAFEFRLQHQSERYSGYDLIFSDPQTPGVSIIVPAFNEEVDIELTVKNLLHLEYPEYEVIVVNDGSTDRTLSRLTASFSLRPVDEGSAPPGGLPVGRVRGVYYSPEHPGLTVVDKENGGKSDALNAGINYSAYGYFLSVDADAMLEPDALLRIIRPVLAEPDRVLAVGGVIRVANGCGIDRGRVAVPQLCTRLLPALQTVEYIRAFLVGRLGMSRLNACPIISGAFGLFAKDIVTAMGGYKRGTVGEDMELIARLHDHCLAERRDYRVVFISDPVCWTEVPETLSVLISQRRRWQRGLLEVLTPRLRCFFRPAYGWLGGLVYPLLFFIESWGALVEALGFVLLLTAGPAGLLRGEQFTALLCASVLFGMSLSIIAFILAEVSLRRYRRFSELLRMAWLCIFENLGYRQLNTLIRILGLWDYLSNRQGWGWMERRGLGESGVLAAVLAAGVLISASVPATAADYPSNAPLYELGMEERKKGNHHGSKDIFAELLRRSPDSDGALEGLALACMALGEYAQARDYLQRWNAKSPGNAYILGLLAQAQRRLDDEAGALATYVELVKADPTDKQARQRLDRGMARLQPGLFPHLKSYESVGTEGLNTPGPQRIAYQGRSADLRGRARLPNKLGLLMGAEYSQEAQRNVSRGFDYYEIFNQTYWLGLEAAPASRLNWRGEYGQSFLSDVKAAGVGRRSFSRARLDGGWDALGSRFRLSAERSPKFLRGTGASTYFSILRQASARAEMETTLKDWTLWLRGAMHDYSDDTTMKAYSLSGSREWGRNLLQPSFSRSQQEFYGASAANRLAYVDVDRTSLRYRRSVEEKYRASAAYAYNRYRDANRLHEFNGDLEAWLPWYKTVSVGYRHSWLDYRATTENYRSADETTHWVGGFWRRGLGFGCWAALGIEHGFFKDSRGAYEGNTYSLEIERYHKEHFSLAAQGRVGSTTVNDRSYSFVLQARYSFR